MNRRQFTQTMMGAAAAAGMNGLPHNRAEAQGGSGVPFHFSVMLWTLNKAAKTFDEQIALCAEAGYEGIELVGEWRSWTDADYARIVPRLKQLGLKVDSMAGIAGSFADPEGGDALVAGMKAAIVAADKLGCPQLLLTSGGRKPGTTMETCVANLRRAMAEAEKAGKEVVIEPIDLLENKMAWLSSVTEAFEICRVIKSPKLKVLYDVYHEQRQAGNLLEKFTGPAPSKGDPTPAGPRNIDLIGLIHIADVPGRNEPGSGEIRYDQIYKTLGQLNYKGYVAMEFFAKAEGTTPAALKKARLEAMAAARG